MNQLKTSQSVIKNLHLEGLRGFSCLLVFFSHALDWEVFLPTGKFISPQITVVLTTLFNGNLGVMFFFVLSGYVMGKVYSYNKLFSIKKYLLKRWTRIYPMYAIAVCMGAILLPTTLWQVVGHLLFLNPDFTPVLAANQVLWSVSYEFGFYLCLPLIFLIQLLRKNKAIPALVLSLIIIVIVSLIGIKLDTNDFAPISWIKGFSLWLIGLVLAWNTDTNNKSIDPNLTPEENTNQFSIQTDYIDNYQNIWSAIIIAISLNSGLPGIVIITKSIFANIPPLLNILISLESFLVVPSILLVFFKLINYKIKQKVEFLLFAGTFILVVLVVFGAFFKGTIWRYPTVLVLAFLALLIRFIKLPKTLNLLYFSYIGSISYGIYIFHMPVMYLVKKIPYFGGGWLEWIARFGISFALTIVISYLIEIKLQPRIRKLFIT